jgi:hypothetical protein
MTSWPSTYCHHEREQQQCKKDDQGSRTKRNRIDILHLIYLEKDDLLLIEMYYPDLYFESILITGNG